MKTSLSNEKDWGGLYGHHWSISKAPPTQVGYLGWQRTIWGFKTRVSFISVIRGDQGGALKNPYRTFSLTDGVAAIWGQWKSAVSWLYH
jgi:hypothetical protein